MDCIFCKIAAGEIPAQTVYANDQVVAIKDLNPQAPHHLLIIPRRHLENVLQLDDPALLLGIMTAVREVTQKLGIAESGFRLLTNVGEDGGQTVPHLHWHLLGGRKMDWPPG